MLCLIVSSNYSQRNTLIPIIENCKFFHHIIKFTKNPNRVRKTQEIIINFYNNEQDFDIEFSTRFQIHVILKNKLNKIFQQEIMYMYYKIINKLSAVYIM